MHSVRAEEPRQVRRAPDARNDQNLVRLTPQPGAGMEQSVQDAEVATSWAPIWCNFRFEVFRFKYRDCGRHCSLLGFQGFNDEYLPRPSARVVPPSSHWSRWGAPSAKRL